MPRLPYVSVSRSWRLLAAAATFAIAVSAIPSLAHAIAWSIESGQLIGSYPALAVSADGTVHEFFRCGTTGTGGCAGHLYYRKRVNGVWTSSEMVDNANSVLQLSAVVDAAGNPRVAYARYNGSVVDYQLRYAYKSNGLWTTELVGTVGAGGNLTLALDSGGNPQIAYFRWTTFQPPSTFAGELRRSWKTGTTWNVEVVSSSGTPQFNDLELNGAGEPRIAYYNNLGHLRLATRSSAGWAYETVDNASQFVSGISLEYTAGGDPRISYYDNLNKDLKYASKTGSTWAKTVLDATGDVGAYSSLVLDASDRPRIAYWDRVNFDVKAAVQLSTGAWDVRIVDAGPTPPGSGGEPIYPSLVLSGGDLYLAYTNNGISPSRSMFATGDYVPPAAVTDMNVGFGRHSWAVAWTVPAGAATFELRQGTSPITDETGWASATTIQSGPASPGWMMCFDALNQSSCSPYHFAVKHTDAAANTSALGNPAGGTTRCTGSMEVLCGGPQDAEVAQAPGRIEFALPHPNPARGPVSLRWQLPVELDGVPFRVVVYDAQGRQVRTLVDRTGRPGSEMATWDLRNEAGQRVARGVYFARLTAAWNTETRTLLVLD